MAALFAAGWLALRSRRVVRGRVDRFVVTTALPDELLSVATRGRRRGRRQGSAITGNPITRRLEHELSRARVDLTPTEILIACAVLALGALLVTVVLGGSVALAAVLGLLAGVLPLFWLRRRHARMLRAFALQLPTMLDSVIASVRAGNDLTAALARVAHEAPEPMRSALGLAVREIEFGMGVEEALEELADRYQNEDLELVVSAIAIEQSVGGNLPKVLELLAATTRQRVTLRDEVRSLTAQQRYSAYMLALFPLVAAIGLLLISPDYLSPMFDGGGRIAMIAAGVLVIVGFTIMRKLGDVEL